jgi:hypothetical protein
MKINPKWIEQFNLAKSWIDKNPERSLLAVSVVGVLLVGFISYQPKDSESQVLETLDTMIPADQTMVTIEVINAESLEGLFGGFALVNIFTTKTALEQGGIKIGTNIKMVRATLNPGKFAVIVPKESAGVFMKYQGPFFVTIQNPNAIQDSQLIDKKSASRIKVVTN